MKKRSIVVLIIIVSLLIATLLYSRFIATSGLRVKEYKVASEKITNDYHGLKIVHISDIHYKTTIFEKELERIVNKINLIRPDIVVLTGDLLDRRKEYNRDDKDILIKYLSAIEAPMGKYAITGNHDIYFDFWEEIIEESGFINLNDTFELIYGSMEPIIISGISTNFYDDSEIDLKVAEFEEFMSSLTEDDTRPIYSILLKHEPDFIDKLNLDNYDLILIGHSHGGQVRLPFFGKIWTPHGSIKYYDEYYNINDTDLFVSSGLGTSGLRLRFFNRPSFNFYRITNK